ncbi:MAG: hypothetical protein ACOYYJ_10260 [Chloroflexota bacterium]
MARKRKRHAPLEKQVEDHFEEVKRYFGSDGTEVLRGRRPRQESKISDRIAYLVDPLLRDLDAGAGDFAGAIIGIACTAWNASLVESPERERMINEFLNALAPVASGDVAVQGLLESFLDRKIEKFPNDRRFITSYKVIPNKDGFKLTVASVDMDNQPKSQT